MNSDHATRRREAAMPFIMVTMLIDMLAIGLIIPVLPAMVGSFTGSQADQAYWYGVVAFTFGLANFVASPILGRCLTSMAAVRCCCSVFWAFASAFSEPPWPLRCG